MNIDLHSHSTASDGTLSPSVLVERAVAQGVDVLALTDHDTTHGLAEAQGRAAELGIRLLPGIEISVTWNGSTIHLLGLGIDPEYVPLQRGLATLIEEREGRGEAIAASLDKAGISGALAGARAFATGPILSRTHFARFLVEGGYAKDSRQVFKRYLVRGRPGFVAGQWAALEDAVGWVRASGGQAVVAHPARYRMTGARLDRLLNDFKACGGVGLEVVSGSHSESEEQVMGRRAQRLGLLGSAGSDFHGPENPWTELGRLRPLPVGVEPLWHLKDFL